MIASAAPGTVQPFSFGDDLARPAQERRVADRRARAEQEARLAEAEREAFGRGVAAGQREAAAETERRVAEAMAGIAAAAGALFSDLDARAAALEEAALAFFAALARGLAGRAVETEPLAAIEEAAREAFRHLRGVPHLAVRVHQSLVEPVDARLGAMAREHGYEGRIIVLGADDLALGDARLDWADGGIALDRDAAEAAIRAVLARNPPLRDPLPAPESSMP